MKYYVVEKNIEGISIKTLCRLKNNIIEIYDYDEKPRGEWLKNEEFEKILKEKNEKYIIYEPNQAEINNLKQEINDFAYDDYHESSSYIKDDKGKRHREYIYQDYRSIDGYCVDGGFEADIILNRKYNDYYQIEDKDLLIKINKDTKEIYIYGVNKVNNSIEKDWISIKKVDNKTKKQVENINFDKMKKSTDYDKIISYTYNKASEKAKKEGIDFYW